MGAPLKENSIYVLAVIRTTLDVALTVVTGWEPLSRKSIYMYTYLFWAKTFVT